MKTYKTKIAEEIGKRFNAHLADVDKLLEGFKLSNGEFAYESFSSCAERFSKSQAPLRDFFLTWVENLHTNTEMQLTTSLFSHLSRDYLYNPAPTAGQLQGSVLEHREYKPTEAFRKCLESALDPNCQWGDYFHLKTLLPPQYTSDTDLVETLVEMCLLARKHVNLTAFAKANKMTYGEAVRHYRPML